MEYMANNVNAGVSIDPALFFVPEDVIDVRASTGPHDDISSEPVPDIDDNEDQTPDESNPDSDIALQTPQWIQIASQVVRIGADGRTVVDVTLEVEEVAGAEDYELRVTK